VCVSVCGGFTQRAPGSRALQWLVKTPLRALGFELAFCQASCQKEAGNTDRLNVCVVRQCVLIYGFVILKRSEDASRNDPRAAFIYELLFTTTVKVY